MATNTTALKTFAQQTRLKLISLISTKLDLVLNHDSAELRGYEDEIAKLKSEVAAKGKDLVVEEVAYTWFNRVMALRFMDANGYTTPNVVTPGAGQMRPEILQDAMGGSVDEDLRITQEDLMLPEAKLYRRLLVASCNYWGASMPFLFEHICDYTELLLPDDLLSDQSFVTDIRNGMTDEDCQNVEIMGWLYQFYITDRKADAETKKSKKGGLKSDEQAAATQLFTPHWVVRYMVENSLGRIWMTLHPESHLIDVMPYYIPTPEGQTDTIPEDIKSVVDIRFIDTCVGSGHIAVYAFDLFCKMYEEEGYRTSEIPALVLTNNIYGIDIDRRCYQLACFALTMKARAYYSRYLRKSVQPNVIALQKIDRDTIETAGNWDSKSTMWQMEHVDTIGSLLQITPEECAKIQVEDGLFGERQRVLKTQAEYLSGKYHCVVTNPPYLGKGMGDFLGGYIKLYFPNSKQDTMATFMERSLELCAPNGKIAMINMQSWMFLSSYEKLREHLLKTHNIDSLLHLGPHAFDEIGGEVVQSATFVIANHHPSKNGGIYYRLVEGSNSSAKENTFLMRENEYCSIKQNNFGKIPGSPVGYWISSHMIAAFSGKPLCESSTPRAGMITGNNNTFVRLWFEIDCNKFSTNCKSIQDSVLSKAKWFPYQKGGSYRKWSGNDEYCVNYENNGWLLKNTKDSKGKVPAHAFNEEYIFTPNVNWSAISSTGFATRITLFGKLFDASGSAAFPFEHEDIWKISAFLNSSVATKMLNVINPTINFQAWEIGNLPFRKFDICDSVVGLAKDSFFISHQDWDAHETSWDFQQNELLSLIGQSDEDLKHFASLQATCSTTATPLQQDSNACALPVQGLCTNAKVLLSDLVDKYHTKWTALFMQLHANEEELNRQFIDIYGLQDELTPDVPLNEITILQKGEIDIKDGEIVWNDAVLIKQLISYLVGCFMGRYSVDKPGLIIASQHQDLNELGLKVEGIDNDAPGRIAIDDDGIVPILAGEYFSDDMTVRIEQAIRTIFGEDNFQANLRYIDEKLGKSLREYLFKDFYADHIDGKMYQKRPIYWLFSSKMGDKRKKGYFKALVYMHRMESDTLSKLHADYVVPYIDKIDQQQREAEDQAMRDDLSQTQRNKARKAADELADQMRELKDFEQILVQMASQRLSIDLDDGVRVNYPKFYPLVEPIKGLDKED